MFKLIRRAVVFFLALILLASCAEARPTPAPTRLPAPTPTTAVPSELRFALIGKATEVNPWALFDESGASYNNYALRADNYPRLYVLAPPDFIFTPRAAQGTPTSIRQDGDFFVSTVTLRSDLKWTNGSAFSAYDVEFTVNAALKFELTYDWKAYSPLARAQAVNRTTVRFYFKQEPNVGVWQYGALQAPILQKAFWESKIKSSAALLPDDSLRASIADAQARIAEAKPRVDELIAKIYVLQSEGKQDRRLDQELKRRRGDLDEATNELTKYLAEYEEKVKAAQNSLFALSGENEPTLGVWMPAGKKDGAWINEANPDFPFEKPEFARVLYLFFDAEHAALKALESGRVDMILSGGDSDFAASATATHLNGAVRFLVFNPSRSALSDPALRRALACTILRSERKDSLPPGGFVLPGNGDWLNPDATLPCSDANGEAARLERAVKILKTAGYSWKREPGEDASGRELTQPDGKAFPRVTLLSPSKEYDQTQASEAKWIEAQAKKLGIPLSVAFVAPQDIRYKTFSSGDFDLALLGWKLSLYPSYFCEWFGARGIFFYNGDRIKSECEALEIESDLDAARARVFEIQSILAEDLPFIPLYAGVTNETYRNIRYPFEKVLGGFGGLYGAPSLAFPSP